MSDRIARARSAVARKSGVLVRRFPRAVARARSSPLDHHRPAVIVNTIPKSGTHLVAQVARSLPGVIDYGSVAATTPSIRHRVNSSGSMVRRIESVAPGELVRAHIWFDRDVAAAIRARSAFLVFLVRDPRAIAVSEAHYLATAAPWHGLHRDFVRLSTRDRLAASIDGLPNREDVFPDIGTRITRYLGWLREADVVLRYEDLRAANPRPAVEQLVRAYRDATAANWSIDDAVESAVTAIEPQSSHTFRVGAADGWRDELDDELIARATELARPVITRLGYDPD